MTKQATIKTHLMVKDHRSGQQHRIRVVKRFGALALEQSFNPHGDLKAPQLWAITAPTLQEVMGAINAVPGYSVARGAYAS